MHRTAVCMLMFVASLGGTASAQTEYAIGTGSFIVGGSVSVTSVGGDELSDRASVISVHPALQYFVVPHLAVGGEFELGYVSGSDKEPRGATTSMGIGPRVGVYFGKPEWRVYPFLASTLFVSHTVVGELTIPQVGRVDPPDRTLLDVQPSGGAAFMISKNVAVTGEAFYRANFAEIEDQSDSVNRNEFGFRFGVAAFVY